MKKKNVLFSKKRRQKTFTSLVILHVKTPYQTVVKVQNTIYCAVKINSAAVDVILKILKFHLAFQNELTFTYRLHFKPSNFKML